MPLLRLLVAEDAAANRLLFKAVLGRHGHQVTIAKNGAEAMARTMEGNLDLVLMDVQMPVMDGLEATRRIRRLPPPLGEVPIVGLTAYVLEEERQHCIAAGMDQVLGKPVAWPELLAMLAEAADQIPYPATLARAAGGGRGQAGSEEGVGPPLGVPAACPSAGGSSADLLQRVIEDAERSCERLRLLPAGSEAAQREAHALKGITGLFGLRRISAPAGEVQAAARAGKEVSKLVEQLREAVAATRDELRGAGLIPE